MKLALSKNRLIATAIILLTASTFADAACRPNNCAQLYDNYNESGAPIRRCESRYTQCLNAYGCPIP